MAEENELIEPVWDIQPRERALDYSLFSQYRSITGIRSIPIFVRQLGYTGDKLRTEIIRVTGISARWQWRYRLNMYEQYIADGQVQRDIEARKEMNERLGDHAKASETALMTVVKKYLEQYNNGNIKFDTLDSKDFIHMLCKVTEKITNVGNFERIIRGEANEISKIDITTNGKEIHRVIVPPVIFSNE